MNVIRTENSKVRPARGRGRHKGRDSLYWKETVHKPIASSFGQPKYQSSVSDASQGLFSAQPGSSSIRTPKNSRQTSRIPTSSSSKMRSSTSSNVQPTSTTTTLDSTVVMAITTGRGDARCEVGIAAIDVKFPHLIICQISDTQTYTNTLTKIHLFNPIEILMPDTICGEEDPRKALYNIVKSKFKDITITPVERIHFNEENGLDRIKRHCSTEFSSIELFVKEKYYALSTTAALLKYVEHIQRIIYEPKSMKIEFQASQGSTLIDIESAINLELVSSQGAQKNHNLFSSIDRCLTPMGRRLLRSSILQPLCDRDAILERQSCVSELVSNRNFHTTLQPIIKQLCGADRALGLSMRTAFAKDNIESAERNLNYVLLLKTCLEVIPQLAKALENAKSQKFIKIRENLNDTRFEGMKEQILQIVHKDAKTVNGYTSANMQRCFALKSGINDMLDVLRQTYCELMEQTSILVDSLAKKYHLPLTVACNASLGYHIQMQVPKHPSFKISDLPNIFIEVQKKRNTLFMTTYLLMSLSQQCKDVRNDLHIMSSCILELLISNLRKDIGCLFQLSEDIAELDLIMSLARISGIPDYVKPIFAQNLRIIDSKHPVVDIIANQLPRPNDIEASIAYNFCNITGPNMSGKTTYLKQIVLLHIMAQNGCYLPAKEATLRIADKFFCRLCPTYEDIESNASSFIHEIREIEFILQFITPSSLVVLDEICRSTSSEEGSPLAFAICESLLQTTAFIFNCTHYIYLTKLTELYHNAVNYYFVCEPNELDKWGLKYTYKLRKGITNVENYGISAATASRLPKSIIDNAKQIVTKIAPHFKPPPLVKAPKLSWQKDCYECIAKLMDFIIADEFTLENVQKVVEPLRGNSNLKNPKNNDLLCNVLQKNFQKQAPNYENVIAEAQIASDVPQTSAGNPRISQYNLEMSKYYEKIVVPDAETLNVHQVNVRGSKVLQKNPGAVSYSQTNSSNFNLQTEGKFSNTDQINPRESNILVDKSLLITRQLDSINSDLNPSDQHQFLQKSSNPYQQRALQQLDDDFSFKIPASPLSKNKKSHEISQRGSDQNSEFGILKQESVKNSLEKKSQHGDQFFAGLRKPTLLDFGFSTKKVDCGPSNFSKFTDENADKETRNDNLKYRISEVSDVKTEKSFSNLSSCAMRSKPSSESTQGSSENSRPRKTSNSSLNTYRNWLQDEIISAGSSWKRFHESDRDENSGLTYSKNNFEKSQFPNQDRRPSFSNHSSDQQDILSRSSNFEKNWRSDDDGISVRTKSQVPSLSNFSPQCSLRRNESRSSNFENNCQSSNDVPRATDGEISFSNFPSPQNVRERHCGNDNSSNFTMSTPFAKQDSRSIFSGKISHEMDSRSIISEKKQQSDESNFAPSYFTALSPESRSSIVTGSFMSDDSVSRSYLSPSYSPLPISSPRELDSSFKKDADNISKSSLSMNWNLNELKNLKRSSDENRSNISRSYSQFGIQASPAESKFISRREEVEFPSQKSQFVLNECFKKEENPMISMLKDSHARGAKMTNSPHSQRDDSPRVVQSQNLKSAGLNLFKFSTPQSRIAKPPIQSDAWKLYELEQFKRAFQTQSQPSNNFSQQSISNEIESEGLLRKFNFNPENFQLNPVDDVVNERNIVEDTISSFNTENFPPSLISPRLQNRISGTPNRCGSQHKSQITVQSKEKISQFESIIDGNTIEFEDISEFPSPKQNTSQDDVCSISSDDTVQASNNVRQKEDAIFREIEENAHDEEMFLNRVFNSPLSMDYSQELCSCSNDSSFKE